MFGRVLQSIGLVLELLGWAGAGVRAIADDRAEERRKKKAAARSAAREADLLKRFERRDDETGQ